MNDQQTAADVANRIAECVVTTSFHGGKKITALHIERTVSILEEWSQQLVRTILRTGTVSDDLKVSVGIATHIGFLNGQRLAVDISRKEGWEKGCMDMREKCAHSARNAMVNNPSADELSCAICASVVWSTPIPEYQWKDETTNVSPQSPPHA